LLKTTLQTEDTPMLLDLGRVGVDMKDNYPAWHRLTDQTSQRPAVQRVLAHEKITLP
jgi:hypothetical protein